MNINLESQTVIYSVELENEIVTVHIHEETESGVLDVQVWLDGTRLGEHDVIDGHLIKDVKRAVCDTHFGDIVG